MTETYVATADPNGHFAGIVGVDRTVEGEFTHDVWAGPPATFGRDEWDSALAEGGWTRITGWEDRDGYWTAVVEDGWEDR